MMARWSLLMVALLALGTVVPSTLADDSPKEPADQADGNDEREYKRLSDEATELSKRAYGLLRADKFAAAEAAYIEAQAAWQVVLDRFADDKRAQRERDRCGRSHFIAISRPIDNERKAVDELVRQGQIRAASDELIRVAQRYTAAAQRIEDRSLIRNRDYCLVKAGVYPLKHADNLFEAGKFAEAVEFYQLGADRTEHLMAVLGNNRYAGNLKYARTKLARSQFAHLLNNQLPAPDLQFETLDGNRMNLSDLRGQVVLVTFWAGWCGACRKQLPILDELFEKHRDAGLTVLALSVDRAASWDRNAADRAQKTAETLHLPTGWASDEQLDAYGKPDAVPRMFWIDASGRLVKRVDGDDRQLEALEREFLLLRDSRSAPTD